MFKLSSVIRSPLNAGSKYSKDTPAHSSKSAYDCFSHYTSHLSDISYKQGCNSIKAKQTSVIIKIIVLPRTLIFPIYFLTLSQDPNKHKILSISRF